MEGVGFSPARDRWRAWALAPPVGVMLRLVRVAAFQADLAATRTIETAVAAVRSQVAACESQGIAILCCPEGMLGGLADYVPEPRALAIDVEGGELASVLAPLASERVATIVGFTEIDRRGVLFNAAAVFHKGEVLGVYRKLHPAINKSVYAAGSETPVFTVGDLTFGIVICLDSRFPEPVSRMAAQGARAVFVPTNNGMPPGKGGPELVAEARALDVAHARGNGIFVIRADVAGRRDELVCYGCSAIVAPDGMALCSAPVLVADLLVADIAS